MSVTSLDEVAEHLPLGVFIVDDRAQPVFVNRVGAGLLGAGVLTPANADNLAELYQVYLAGTDELCPGDQLPVVRALRGETLISEDLCIRRPEGDVPVRVWATPIRADDGRVEAAVAVFWDALDDSEASRALSFMFTRHKEDVAELDRLRDLRGRFLTAVNHELRTPLTSMLGALDTLHESADRLSPDEQRELIDRAWTTARRLDLMLAGLLDLNDIVTEMDDPERVVFDLAVVIPSVVTHTATGGRAVMVDARPAWIEANEAQAARVVHALLDNALVHTPPGAPIWLSTYTAGHEAVIEVSDAGAGIPASLRGQVLQPFEQGANPSAHAPGLGIGLALVARFAEMHRGRVELDDRPGGGTRVRVFLARR